MIRMRDVLRALEQYQRRFRFLDVMAADVTDLDAMPWREAGDDYECEIAGVRVRVRGLSRGVARFRLSDQDPPPVGALVAGGAVGAALGAATKEDGGVLVGALIGMLVGALAGGPPAMNRVMALRFDPATFAWRVYEGPLLRVAKTRLAPGR